MDDAHAEFVMRECLGQKALDGIARDPDGHLVKIDFRANTEMPATQLFEQPLRLSGLQIENFIAEFDGSGIKCVSKQLITDGGFVTFELFRQWRGPGDCGW